MDFRFKVHNPPVNIKASIKEKKGGVFHKVNLLLLPLSPFWINRAISIAERARWKAYSWAKTDEAMPTGRELGGALALLKNLGLYPTTPPSSTHIIVFSLFSFFSSHTFGLAPCGVSFSLFDGLLEKRGVH